MLPFDDTLEAALFRQEDAVPYTAGLTIASIKCEENGLHAEPDTFDDRGSPALPALRIDTSSPSTASTHSPLVLVSDFLGTLAGLVQSPLTPMTPQDSKFDDSIMILDSHVFVDMIMDIEDEPADGCDLECPPDDTDQPAEWGFWSPGPDRPKSLEGPNNHLDALLAVGGFSRGGELAEWTDLHCR